jgi:hypothetical protein
MPSIIYGQTLLALVRGKAEVQVFQVVAEMLEDNVIPTTETINNVFFELSKLASYKVSLSCLVVNCMIFEMIVDYGRNLEPLQSLSSSLRTCGL